MAVKRLRRVEDLEPDRRNANRGTERGAAMLERSLEELGAGRSILIDRAGRIIAGNKTAEAAVERGITELIVVQTDGRKIVAVQRTDLDLERDAKARKLAIADNRVGEVNLDWDRGLLQELAGDLDLAHLFSEKELGKPEDENGEIAECCPACGQKIRKARQA